jgi:hypothetical protein
MMSGKKELRSDIAWSTADKIGVHGYDLTEELIGEVNLGDMAFLEVRGHILEEARQPIAMDLWHRTEDEATRHMSGQFRKTGE